MELDNSESHPKQVPAFLPLLFVAIAAKRFSKLQCQPLWIHSISDMISLRASIAIKGKTMLGLCQVASFDQYLFWL